MGSCKGRILTSTIANICRKLPCARWHWNNEQLIPQKVCWCCFVSDLPPADLEAAETRQQTHWDEFYKCNKEKFFKDRMYLAREFPFLDPAKKDSPFEWKTCMEIGCGVGNTIVPLFRAFPDRRFVASDFAPSAVDLLKVLKVPPCIYLFSSKRPTLAFGQSSALPTFATSRRSPLCALTFRLAAWTL